MRRYKNLLLMLGLLLGAAIWLFIIAVSWASSDARAEESDVRSSSSGSGAEDEYNFSWLDPDKKVFVLQNRKYLKKDRVMVSVLGGPAISNAYRNSFGVGPRVGYYFDETWGFEGFLTGFTNSQNGTFRQLTLATNNVIPVVREIKVQGGFLLHYVPWYAKINVFNSIIYFDWYFEGGLGGIASELDTRTHATKAPAITKQNFMAGYLGTGHLFHINDSFLIRLDFMGAFYQALDGGTSGRQTLFSNYLFGLGAGFRI